VPWIHYIMCYNIITAVKNELLQTNKDNATELSNVFKLASCS